MPRPHVKGPGVEAGVTEPMIRELVERFYARVRGDKILGPMFEAKIGNWEAHINKLVNFWSSVTLMTGRYKGNPMQAHAVLPDLTAEHFDHWLDLFRATAVNVCPPKAAMFFY